MSTPQFVSAGREPSSAVRTATTWRAGLVGICGLLLLPHAALALDPARTVYQYHCQSWTRQDGLPARSVNAIAQTKDGFLWLGLIAGPVRFDGVSFELADMGQAFRSRSTEVQSLSAGKDGGLWLGIAGSAFAHRDPAGNWAEGREEWGGVDQPVNAILEARNGDVWLTAQTGVGRLIAQKTYETILPSAACPGSFDVHAPYEDSHGRIWFGTSRQGLFYWHDGVLAQFPDPALDAVVIRAVVEDQQGRIWVGSENGTLCYDAKFQRVANAAPASGVSVFLVDRHGTLWIGTNGAGLVCYRDGVATVLRKNDGLADDFITALAEDHEGSLWVGTSNGLSQLSDVKIPTFGKTEGLTNDVNISVHPAREGGLWIATSGGFTHFDGGTKIRAYGAEVGLGNAYIITLLEAKNGDVYLVNGGMEFLVFSGGKTVARYPNKTWPTALVEDERGVVGFVDGKLWRVSPGAISPYLLADGQQAALPYVFNMIAGHDGSIWVAAAETGIVQIKDGQLRTWPVRVGSRLGKVMWIAQDEAGVVWAASTEGLARVKNGTLRSITHSDGLVDNLLTAAVLDDHGSFWVDSNRGIFSVSRQSLNDFADGKIDRVESRAFDSLNDVKSRERNQQKPSGCKTLDGRVWFPTANGVVMIDPTGIAANPVPPEVHVEIVRANGRELRQSVSAIVPPGKGELEFQFAALSFVARPKIQFRYRLEGYDKEWVGPTTRRMAFYTNLAPGRYTFRVLAANADGVWNEAGAALRLELLPHFYQQAWFHALVAAAALAALAGVYAWRVRLLRHRENELRASRDRLEIEVAHRTAELAGANSSLHAEIADHKQTEAQLLQKKQSLENEIEEGRRLQREIERVQAELLLASRAAGRAEVATGVLHNVGNVLNSVNVSATVVADRVRHSKQANVAKLAALFGEHAADLPAFLTQDPRGRMIPGYLATLKDSLAEEQAVLLTELDHLRRNIEHIKDIVVMQQSYAKNSGFIETVPLADLVEDALRMNASSLLRHDVEVVRDFQLHPTLSTDKHKVVQILVNLVGNARHACDETGRPDKRIVVRIAGDARWVRVSVADNGVGIPAENIDRIFSHGFTTKKGGHGFGLHSGALAAKELGGALTVQSAGTGQGATFILELPFKPVVPAP